MIFDCMCKAKPRFVEHCKMVWVQCEVCGSRGPKQASAGQAELLWNEMQTSIDESIRAREALEHVEKNQEIDHQRKVHQNYEDKLFMASCHALQGLIVKPVKSGPRCTADVDRIASNAVSQAKALLVALGIGG